MLIFDKQIKPFFGCIGRNVCRTDSQKGAISIFVVYPVNNSKNLGCSEPRVLNCAQLRQREAESPRAADRRKATRDDGARRHRSLDYKQRANAKSFRIGSKVYFARLQEGDCHRRENSKLENGRKCRDQKHLKAAFGPKSQKEKSRALRTPLL